MSDPKAESPPTVAATWSDANKQTRAAATWLTVTLGGLAVGIFGAAPAVRGLDFDWNDAGDRTQLLVSLVFGVLGIGGMIILIIRVASLQVPVFSTFQDLLLDERKVKGINANEQYLLPPGITTVAALDAKMTDLRELITFYTSAVDKAKAAGDRGKAALATYKRSLVSAASDLTTYQSWADFLVHLRNFRTVKRGFVRTSTWLLIAAAAIGSLGFTFALAKPKADDTPAAASPVVGYIVPGSDKKASELIWATFDLQACQTSKSGSVPVIVISSAGDSHTVQTISGAGCAVWQFDVRPETATLMVAPAPRKIEIEYSPTKK